MSLSSVLKASKGIPVDDFFDLLFAQSISGEQWQVYDGTLPATLNANGSNMKQYQIWGNTGGVGDKTVQLFDKNATDTDNGYVSGAYIKSDGELQNSSAWFVSEYIPVNAEDQYTVVYGSQSSSRAVCYYDINKNYISGVNYSGLSTQETITTPSTCAYMRLSLVLTAEDIITITPGTTPPETFVPFGYEVDMSVKSGNILYAAETVDVTSGDLTISAVENSSTFVVNKSVGSSNFSVQIPLNIALSAGTYTLAVFGLNIVNASFDRIYLRDTNNDYYGIDTMTGNAKKFTISESVTLNRLYFVCHSTSVYDNKNVGVTLTPGTTPPDEYQPYSNTTTPIYVGNEPLDKDEYIDYQDGKIYRIINGTLTPTDPPVTLPALPTVEGETIVNFSGSGTAPEKVLLKYRKEDSDVNAY